MPASGWLASSTGVISGGVLAIVADIAFGCSIETQLPAATTYTTAELSMSFLRPARPGATLQPMDRRSTSDARSRCRRSSCSRRDGERLIAHGTSRLSVFPPLRDPPRATGRARRPSSLATTARRTRSSARPPRRPSRRRSGPSSRARRSCAASSPASSRRRPFITSPGCGSPRSARHGHLRASRDRMARELPPAGSREASIAMLADFAMLAAVETMAASGRRDRRPRPEGELPAPGAARRQRSDGPRRGRPQRPHDRDHPRRGHERRGQAGAAGHGLVDVPARPPREPRRGRARPAPTD